MSARAILRFCARALLVRRKLVFEADLDDLRQAEPRIPARFRPGNQNDLMRLSQDAHEYDAAFREFGLERLQAGDLLTLAESRNDVVFYSWLMFGQLDMGMRRYLPTASDTACVYRLFTVAAHRGLGLAPAWFWFIRETLRRRNMRRVVAWVESRNTTSRRAFERAGFRRIGCIWHVQFLFRIYFFVSPSLRARLRGEAARVVSAPQTARAAR